MLVFATWAQRAQVRCEYFGEQIRDGRGGHNEKYHEDYHVSTHTHTNTHGKSSLKA